MKQILIGLSFLIISSFMNCLSAQIYCLPILEKADSLYQNQNYKAALTALYKAGDCDFENTYRERRRQLQIQLFDAIEQQKQEALNAKHSERNAKKEALRSEAIALLAKSEAEAEKDKAEKATRVAESQKAIADRAKIKAIAEKDKADKATIVAKEKAAIAEARRLSQLSNIVRKRKAYQDALCLAYLSLKKELHDPQVKALLYGAFGDALYQNPNSIYKKTIGTQVLKTPLIHYQLVADEKKIITINRDNIARLWNFEGELLAHITIKSRFVRAFQISPNGKLALIGNDNGVLIFWNLKTYKKKMIEAHDAEIMGLSFSPDGQKILTWSRDRSAKFWNLEGEEIQKFMHQDNIYQADFFPDGQKIFTRSADWSVKIWRINGTLIHTINHQSYIHNTTFSANSKQLISCSSDGTAKLWGEENNVLTLTHPKAVIAAVFSFDGKKIITQSLDHQLRLWNSKGEKLDSISMNGIVKSFVFFENGTKVLAGSEGTELKIWDFMNNNIIQLNDHIGAVTAIHLSQDEQYILSQSEKQKAILWDNQGHRLMSLNHQVQLAPLLMTSTNYIITSPDGKALEIIVNPIQVFKQMVLNPEVCKFDVDKKKEYGLE